MIEAMIVVLVVMTIFVFFLSLLFLYYERWNVQYIADDVASKVADAYKYNPDTTEIKAGSIKVDLSDEKLYRYGGLFGRQEALDTLESNSQKNANEYIKKMFALTSFAKPKKKETCEVDIVEDALGRRHVRVEVTGTYAIPFGGGLEMVGMDGVRTFSASSVAECVDLIDYIGTVNYVKAMPKLLKVDKILFVDAIDSFLKLLNNVTHKNPNDPF